MLSLAQAIHKALPARQPGYRPQEHHRCPQCQDTGWVFQSASAQPCSCSSGWHPPQTSIRNTMPVPQELARQMTLETFDIEGPPSASPEHQSSLRRALATITEWAQDPMGWLIITGPPGTGKTHLSIAAAQTFLSEERFVAFTTVAELLQRLRRSSLSDYEDPTLEQAKTGDLLILDDMGKERTTSFTEENIHTILDYRYARSLPTIITSNLDLPALANIRPAVASRMADFRRSTHIIIQSPDYRANEWD